MSYITPAKLGKFKEKQDEYNEGKFVNQQTISDEANALAVLEGAEGSDDTKLPSLSVLLAVFNALVITESEIDEIIG